MEHGISRNLSYLMIVFLNAGSFPGRWLPGILAGRFGRLNTMILTNLLCIVAMFAIWLPAKDNAAAVIVFSVVCLALRAAATLAWCPCAWASTARQTTTAATTRRFTRL